MKLNVKKFAEMPIAKHNMKIFVAVSKKTVVSLDAIVFWIS